MSKYVFKSNVKCGKMTKVVCDFPTQLSGYVVRKIFKRELNWWRIEIKLFA